MPTSCADIALVCCLDKNHVCVDELGHRQMRFFEQEAARLVHSLRENGGWMSGMAVYMLQPARNGRHVPEATLAKLH